MAETVAIALMWLLLVAFLAGLVVALVPYVHDAWLVQTAAVAARLTVLAALPVAPRPACEPRALALPVVSLRRHGRHRAGVA